MGLAADMGMFNRKHIFSGMKSHFVVHALKAIATIILWFVYLAYSPSDMHFGPMRIGKIGNMERRVKHTQREREEAHQTIFTFALLLYKNQYNEANISTQMACNTQFRSDTIDLSHSLFIPLSLQRETENWWDIFKSRMQWRILGRLHFFALGIHAHFLCRKHINSMNVAERFQ